MRVGKLPFKIEPVLGFLMASVGLIGAYVLLMDPDEVPHLEFMLLGRVLMILFGILIVMDPRKNKLRAVGLYAIALGLSRMIHAVSYLSSESYLFGAVIALLGISLIYCGQSYFRGTSKNPRNLKLIAYAMMISYIVMMAFFFHYGGSVRDFLEQHYDIFPLMAMYGVYIIILSSDEIRVNSPMDKLYGTVRSIRENVHADPQSSISRNDAIMIYKGMKDRSSWKRSDDDGPVESEILIDITHSKDRKTMIIQKWRDQNGLNATIVNDPDGAFIQCYRFNFTNVEPENGDIDTCKYIRLYGEDEIFARLLVDGGRRQ